MSADLMGLAHDERSDLLALLRQLTPRQWAAPSLCDGWSVRDVAVHTVSYDPLGRGETALEFLRGALRPSRINANVLHRYHHLTNDQVVELVACHLRPRGLTAGLGGGIALADGTIHHQDIRRALNLPRTIPDLRIRAVLDLALTAPTLPARRNARQLRLVATDLDWSTGSGPEVSGPAEAILMTIAGRTHALADVTGSGTATLARRIAG